MNKQTVSQPEPIIKIENLGKRFELVTEAPDSILELLISPFSKDKRARRVKRTKSPLWAVKDINLDIFPGESIGFIGKNGSGKSTLLKLITRVLHPTTGTITVYGKVGALLELGTGFHPDLTGRENIYLNASLLGLPKDEVRHLFDDIVAFSELENFIDMPVKHYSSGMYMRLGFSVAIHIQPDILIVDEILSVGDQAFQTKCLDRIRDMQRQGVTLIMVSHDLNMVRKMCSHLVWMEKGAMLASGLTEKVADEYKSYSAGLDIASMRQMETVADFKRTGSGEAQITAVRILDSNGNEERLFKTHDTLTIEMDYIAHEEIEQPEFGLAIYREDGLHINGPNTQFAGLDIEKIHGEGKVSYTVVDLPLMPARYLVTVAISDSNFPRSYDYHEQAYTFRVVAGGTKEEWGAIDLFANWDWTPSQSTQLS